MPKVGFCRVSVLDTLPDQCPLRLFVTLFQPSISLSPDHERPPDMSLTKFHPPLISYLQ